MIMEEYNKKYTIYAAYPDGKIEKVRENYDIDSAMAFLESVATANLDYDFLSCESVVEGERNVRYQAVDVTDRNFEHGGVYQAFKMEIKE